MTLGEQLELAIYKFVESVGKGQGRSVNLGTLTGLITGVQDVDTVDAIVRLHDDGFVSLVKYDFGPDPVSYIDTRRDNSTFFYRGTFKITVTARGRLDLERKEAAVPDPPPAKTKKSKREFRTALNIYDDEAQIGEGGSGTVSRVRDDDGNLYALKLLKKESLDGSRQKRFQSELRFCMKAPHANIIEVLDHGLFGDDERPFFVMPLYESTLRKAMRKGIDPAQIPQIVHQIVMAIEFAHARQIFHRDLKPENILCTADLRSVVLADFGIAHFSEEALLSAVKTDDQERLANFKYAAPEQRMLGSQVGAPADIWALGLILHELFTGQLALGRRPKLIADVAPESGRFDALVELMLSQTPEERPSIGTVKPYFPLAARSTTATEEMVASTGPEMTVPAELRASSPDNIWLHVARHPTLPGLIFDLMNRRTNNVKDCVVYVIDARSFDISAAAYRENFGLKKRRLSLHKEVLAGDVTKSSWLLRIKDGHLEMGNSVGDGVLKWPAGDNGGSQIWLLTLLIEAVDIEPWTVGLKVTWQQETDSLGISEAQS
jgi:serine/threonine protein kinase